MADRIEVQVSGEAEVPAHVSDGGSSGGVSRVVIDPSKVVEKAPAVSGESLFAGKYKTVEELSKAYKELESRLGTSQEATPKAGEVPKPVEVAKTVEKAGLDMATLSKEFAEQGALSADSLTKLTAAGVTAETVGQYVKGQQALVAQYDAQMAAVVGGKDQLTAIIAWAGTNLTKSEIEAVNDSLTSMNEAKGKLALEGLRSRYVAANGTDPKLVTGAGNPAPHMQTFRSHDEMYKAMRDPRYKTDPAYQADVMARMEHAEFMSATAF